MDHVVYVDAKAKELENLLEGKKRMVLRGATGRKLPYGRVQVGDCLFFILNNGDGFVRAIAHVTSVFNSEKLSEAESHRVIEENQELLQLTPQQFQRWAGKRYLVLIGVDLAVPIKPFPIDRSGYGNMDDWLPVGDINKVIMK